MGKRDSAGSADAEDSSSKNLDIQWIRWHGDANAAKGSSPAQWVLLSKDHSSFLMKIRLTKTHLALADRDLRESFSCQGRMLRRQLFPMRLRETWPDVTEL